MLSKQELLLEYLKSNKFNKILMICILNKLRRLELISSAEYMELKIEVIKKE